MKNSFVLYTSYSEHLQLLNREQRGDLFSAIMAYATGEDLPDMDGITKMAFSFIKTDMDRDQAKYERTCEARREAGKAGGRPKANAYSEKAKKANGFFEKQTEAKKPDDEDEYDDEDDLKEILAKASTKKGPDPKPAAEYPYKAITDYLNEKAGKAFLDKSKDTRKHIKARMDEGFTLDDFYKVIDNTVKRWKGDPKMCDYLRPSTLFGTKFESYLNMTDAVPVPTKGKQVQFPQRSYDMKALEKALTGGGT